MFPAMRARLLPIYAAGQAIAILGFLLVPRGGWTQTVWQVLVGWVASMVIFIGVRRLRPAGAMAWYLFGVGVFFNALGLLTEVALQRCCGIEESPNLADAFYLALYFCFIVGLAYLVYRRSAREDNWGLFLGTTLCALVTLVLAIFAWELIVWSTTDRTLSFAKRLIWTIYPLADLMVIAFVLRLIFAGTGRNPAFVLVVAAICCLLIVDIGWAVILRSGVTPGNLTRKLLEMSAMTSWALMGAAALHPAVKEIAPADATGRHPRLSRIGWAALAVCALTAPTALAVHALLDRAYALSTF
jgi:hypothetical protein